MKRSLVVALCLTALLAVAAGSASAADLTKLGSKTLLLNNGQGEVKIKNAAQVTELVIRVNKEQVNLQELKLVLADGSESTVEVGQKLRPGIDSEPIALAAPSVLKSVTLIVDGTSYVASTRVPVTVYGS